MGFNRIGKNVVIYDTAKIVHPENVEIGNNVIIDDFVFIVANKRIKIGSNIHITSYVSITGNEEFVMEDFSGLASGTRVYTSTDYLNDCYLKNETSEIDLLYSYSAPVLIKKFSIVGSNSVILPGAVLSEGTFIGAKSLVKENTVTEAFSQYVGSPIRKLKSMNKDKILELEKEYMAKYNNERVRLH